MEKPGHVTIIKPCYIYAYTTGHSCETALLRVYNDSVTTIGRGNGAMLVLLDLSAILTSLIMIICFAYWKNMTEFVVMH